MIPTQDEEFTVFLEEAREDVASIEQHVLTLESQGSSLDDAVVNTMFRAVHTIKGNAGFFAVKPITELAHAIENALGLLRSHQLICNQDLASALLEGTDLLSRMLHDVEHLEEFDRGPIVARLNRLAVPDASRESGSAVAPVEGRPSLGRTAAVEAGGAMSASVGSRPKGSDPGPAPPACKPAPDPPALSSEASSSPEKRAATDESEETPRAPAPARDADSASSVRVKLVQLDRLMRLAGELVLTRNALLKKSADRDLTAMVSLTQQVDAITSELQEGVMATRMQPVGVVFTKFRRVVRDLATSLAKKIELTIEGEDVELDKTLIEAIGNPLTHLIRNAADHGIESADKRTAQGKREHGTIALRAFHQAGQVVIQVSDDGAGIDGDRVAAKALEKGLVTAEQVQAMSQDQRVRLIFLPGLSTASSITQVSGRGVGMDVVLSDLTKVGGAVDIQSEIGRRTTITVRLPLTLAIIPSILVRVNEQRFAVPQVSLLELVRIPPGEIQRKVERVGSAEVIRLREQLLPLVRLTDVLGIEHVYTDPATGQAAQDRRKQGFDRRSAAADEAMADEAMADEAMASEAMASEATEAPHERRTGSERRSRATGTVYVAVVAAGNIRYGLVVDQLLDSEEIVVKPLGDHLSGCREYAGATILGDGSVALILDVAGISASAKLGAMQQLIDDVQARRRSERLSHDAQPYLVIENAPNELFGIPLGLVSRIERITADEVTTVAGRCTITRGGSLLPVLAIEDLAKVTPRPAAKVTFLAICHVAERDVGIAASNILDVMDGTGVIDGQTHVQSGILGSTVIDGTVLLLLDVFGLVRTLLPQYRTDVGASAEAKKAEGCVLLVEDSPFFRKQIGASLVEDGLTVIAAKDGEDGLAELEAHAAKVDLIVSDVEMPRLDGLEMARRIRSDRRFADLPILAVTSVSGEVAEQRGREAGITEYLIKLDRDHLIQRVNYYLNRARLPNARQVP